MSFGGFVHAGVLLPALAGCAGVYVEAQAASYPSLALSANAGSTPQSGPVVSGSSYGIGLAAGVDFDMSRKHRFALGYQSITTHIGGGGQTAGGSSDARFDLKLVALGESVRIRLAMGLGFGAADSTGYKDGSGTMLAADKGGNAGALYAGPAISRYFGAHHELTAMLGAQYFFASVPSGSIGGAGGVVKLTYTFHIANSWPDVYFDMSVAVASNIMPIIQQAGEQAGCEGQAMTISDNTAAVLALTCSGKGSIFFSQSTERLAGFCQNMSAASCHTLVHTIDVKAAALISALAAPSASAPIANPPPASPAAAAPAAASPAVAAPAEASPAVAAPAAPPPSPPSPPDTAPPAN